MRLIDADAISYESIDTSDTGRHEHYYGTGIIAVRKEDIDAQPTIQPEPHWIPVTERLPEEDDSIFARYYGTDRWSKSMFRKKSREVLVTSVFEDGELHTEVAHTTDGEWRVGVNVVPRTVIAWMPLPEPYKGVTE